MNIRTTVKTITTPLAAAIVLMLALSGGANAEKHKQIIQGKEVVVHTSPIPVILHRMVPPQYGRHVTQKEVSKGMIPQPRTNNSVRKRS